jgi:hypothetical protein
VQHLIAAWERISHDVMEDAWDIHAWGSASELEDNGDGEFQLRMSLQDLHDRAETRPAGKQSFRPHVGSSFCLFRRELD